METTTQTDGTTLVRLGVLHLEEEDVRVVKEQVDTNNARVKKVA